jgi:hypothetical protein
MLLSKRQQLNLLDLYDEEVKSRLVLHLDRVDNFFGQLVHKNRLREIIECAESVSDVAGANTIWQELCTSAMNDRLYETVLHFLVEGFLQDLTWIMHDFSGH